MNAYDLSCRSGDMSILSIATSGLSAASLRVNVAASNIANVQTTGPLPASGGSGTSAAAGSSGIAPTFPAAYVPLRVDQVSQSRELLYDGFDRLGVRYWKSDANFVLARFDGRGPQIASALASRGVHVRDRSNEEGCADCLRVTAGIVEHTREFLAALESAL